MLRNRVMKPVRRPPSPLSEPQPGCFRVPGHCYDVCPAGQKDANGKVEPRWADNRDKLALSGTSFGKILPNEHPLKAKGSAEDVMKAFVFNDKPNYSSFALRMFASGNDCEPVAAAKFCELEGAELEYPGLLISEKHPLIGGSPDGISKDGTFIVEIKTLVRRKMEFDENHEPKVPQYYLAQANFYMWLTNIRRCAFIQYDMNTGKLYVTWLDYMEEAMETALEHAFAFVAEAEERRRAWRETIDELKTAVEYLDRGITVLEDEAEDEDTREYTPIRPRAGAAAGWIDAQFEKINKMVEEMDTPKQKRAYTPRKRAPPPIEHTEEDGADLTPEMEAQIKRFKTLK